MELEPPSNETGRARKTVPLSAFDCQRRGQLQKVSPSGIGNGTVRCWRLWNLWIQNAGSSKLPSCWLRLLAIIQTTRFSAD